MMPELITEMRTDFLDPDNATVREFMVVPSLKVSLHGKGRLLLYAEDVHDDLRGKVAVLHNHGWIHDVSVGTLPRYRIGEEFVQILCAHRSKVT